MAVNLLPSHVPIGYVNNDITQPIYASPELTRALTTMMQQIGGQSTAGPGDVTGLAAVGIEHGIRITGTLPTPTPDDLEVWVSADNIIAHAVMQTHGLLSSWDWIGLTSADGVKYIWVRTVFKSGKKGNFVGPVSAEAGINAVPGNITGLTATPIIGGIRISGTLPADLDLAEVELWTNTVNNVNTAVLQTHGLAAKIDVLNLLPSAGTQYFWARAVNTSGARGAFAGPVNAIAGTADWQTQVTGTGKPVDFADVTTTILSNSGTSVTMTSSNLFKTTTGLGGVFIGGGGLFGKDTSGNVTFSINGSTGAATFSGALSAATGTFSGNITGAANIDIAGAAHFTGSYSDGTNVATVYAKTLTAGVNAVYGSAGTGAGVMGLSLGGDGIAGYSFSATMAGGYLSNGSGGPALQLDGPMVTNNSTLVTNLNADKVDGFHAGNASGNVAVNNGTVNTNLLAASAVQITNGIHSYTFSGGAATGTATATFNGSNKPGANSAGIWIQMTVDGSSFWTQVWPN